MGFCQTYESIVGKIRILGQWIEVVAEPTWETFGMDNPSNVVLIRGPIKGLVISKIEKNYLRSESDDNASMLGAIALALTGNGGMAMGTLNAVGSGGEWVDLVEFEIDGQRTKGIVWKFPFSESDEVEVVAERRSKHPWTCLSVRRVSDGLLAVHPHCNRGCQAYLLTCVKIMLIIGIPFAGAMTLMFRGQPGEDLGTKCLLIAFAFCICSLVVGFFSAVAYFKDRQFIRLAELIFITFGWSQPTLINLPRASKKHRKAEDKFPYGWTFFRYIP